MLNVLHVVTLYGAILSGELNPNEVTPRTFVFGAKAAPGYFMAKEIIHLINAVARTLVTSACRDGSLSLPRELQRDPG